MTAHCDDRDFNLQYFASPNAILIQSTLSKERQKTSHVSALQAVQRTAASNIGRDLHEAQQYAEAEGCHQV